MKGSKEDAQQEEKEKESTRWREGGEEKLYTRLEGESREEAFVLESDELQWKWSAHSRVYGTHRHRDAAIDIDWFISVDSNRGPCASMTRLAKDEKGVLASGGDVCLRSRAPT